MAKDLFSSVYDGIREERAAYRNQQVEHPKPVEINTKKSLTKGKNDPKAAFTPLKKMDSQAELERELKKQRKLFEPFMRDIAPALESKRTRFVVPKADWRIETEADRKDFQSVLSGAGDWEKVDLPHYGEPLGKAVTYYRTTFKLKKGELAGQRAMLRFGGVDYEADVFVNDSFVGSHEGFFAPFSCDFTAHAKAGVNTLLVKVTNDYNCPGDGSAPDEPASGNKIYAATGLGYDDPERGWHHCPPGMGIYQDVFVELCAPMFIDDVFVRPLPDDEKAEVWVEVDSNDPYTKIASLRFSLYGQNFKKTVFKDELYEPMTVSEVGFGDDLEIAKQLSAGVYGDPLPLGVESGINYFRVAFDMKKFRWWTLDKPWLYQMQVTLIDADGKDIDTKAVHFGMRTFEMDANSEPKGEFRFNGKEIRLRGANTMGHLQQCVFKKDFDQLRDDILLARICNMNFLRLTQRPVQHEIYDYCDRLGMMAQTDLPLFGTLRRQHVAELVRQSEEMERIVRIHPSNVISSFMNEHFPNGNNHPHRNLSRVEVEKFYEMASAIIVMANPERCIKPTDGDYDPPSPSFPDRHCYSAWYNGQGVDIGLLNKGYWQPVKRGWNFGCGEFGSEGLDPVNVMRKYYPKSWLPQSKEDEKTWSPTSVLRAQVGMFHYLFHDTPDSLESWVEESHLYQAWATSTMTEAFRRESRMTTFAIHLFIDAFPAGWMKTIMDVDRQPKKSYFAYRDALEPLLPTLRADRFTYRSGETVGVEAWISNDANERPQNASLHFQFEMNGRVLKSGKSKAKIMSCDSAFQGMLNYRAPKVNERGTMTVRIAVVAGGKVLNDYAMNLEIFPAVEAVAPQSVSIIGNRNCKAAKLSRELELTNSYAEELQDIILVDDYAAYDARREEIDAAVNDGARLIFAPLASGSYDVAGTAVKAKLTSMGSMHFVSRNTGHAMVEGFEKNDFRLWYDPKVDAFAALMDTTFSSDGFNTVLSSGNLDDNGKWTTMQAVAEKKQGKGSVLISQLWMEGRLATNPVAEDFARRLFGLV